MSLTRSRTIQYVGILFALFSIAGGYWYFSVRAGSKLNAPETGMLTSGLVGYWTFDGADSTSSTVTDKSGSGNNGTLNNSPQKVAGKVGQALNFFPSGSDSNSRVDMGDPAGGQLDFGSGDFSVGFWMKNRGYSDQSSGANVALAKKNLDSGIGAGYDFQYGSNNLLIFVIGNGSSAFTVYTSTSIADNQWHHYVGLRSGSTMSLYMDGVFIGSAAISGSTSNSEKFTVGTDDVGANGNPRNANADIDEVRVYNRALAVGEIQSLYDLGSSDKVNSSTSQKQGGGTLGNSLAGYWALDNGSGTSATDSSTNGNTGTLTNSPTWGTGQIGTAVDFNGSSHFISIGNPTPLNLTGTMTATAWIKLAGTQSNKVIVGRWGTDQSYVLGIDTSNDKLLFCIRVSEVNKCATTTSTYNDSAWHHVTGYFNGANVGIIVDGGKEVIVGTATTGPIDSPSQNVNIGAYNDGTGNFYGLIDEVRIYSRTLSTDEISQLYRLTSATVVDTGLKGYWSFDGRDTSSTTAYDRSGVGNNATLSNGPAVAPGQVSQALSFDGTNDALSVPINLSGTSIVSMSFWLKWTTFGTDDKLAFEYTNNFGAKNGFLVDPNNSSAPTTGMFTFGTSQTTGTKFWTDGFPVPSAGEWHHYVLIMNRATPANTAYVDGVLQSLTAQVHNGSAMGNFDNSSLYFMSRGTTSLFGVGSLDEVRIYNRALAAWEAQSLYDSGASDKVNSSISTPQGTGRLDSGVSGYWKFDDGSGTSAVDSSINGNTLTLSNGPTWGTGRIESALTFFPGGSDTNAYAWITDPTSGVLDFGTGDFTVAFWAKGRGYSAQGSSANVLLAKKNIDASNAAGWYFYLSSTSLLGMNVNGGSDASAIYIGGATPVMSDDTWHHIVGLRRGSTVRLYADGAFLTSGTNAGSVSNVMNFYIGDDGTGIRNFKGDIDEVRTYNRALSDDEVSQLYRLTNPTNIDTSLRGYWSFNGQDVSGTTAFDRSGAGNNGAFTAVAVPGKLGQALNFFPNGNDTNARMVIGDPASGVLDFGSGDFSVSIFARARGYAAQGSSLNLLLEKKDTDTWTSAGYGFAIDNSSNIFFQVGDGSTNNTLYTAGSVTDNIWHHYVGVRSGNNLYLYVDGSLVTTGSVSGSTSNTQGLYIGSDNGGGNGNDRNANADIDEVRIYSRALSSTEVSALYNQGR